MKLLKLTCPKKISNKKLYKLTKQEPLSKVIKHRRFKWLGHVLRLNEESVVKSKKMKVTKKKTNFTKTATTTIKCKLH